MLNPANKKNNLEILISTTNKINLDFINLIFFENKKYNYPILIVNQSPKHLNSRKPNVKVINSDTKGLAVSRNIAIKNAANTYCLFADDDIIYKHNFYEIIMTEFSNYPKADIITFRMEDKQGNPFKNYTDIRNHNKKSLRDVNSVVIAFKKDSIVKKNLEFNPLFGLGSIFPTGDEYIFLMECLDKGLNIISSPKIILSHDSKSSGKMAYTDENIYARAAIFYKFFGYLAYFKLIHHIYLLKKNNMINSNQLVSKFLIGVSGINKFKSIK